VDAYARAAEGRAAHTAHLPEISSTATLDFSLYDGLLDYVVCRTRAGGSAGHRPSRGTDSE